MSRLARPRARARLRLLAPLLAGALAAAVLPPAGAQAAGDLPAGFERPTPARKIMPTGGQVGAPTSSKAEYVQDRVLVRFDRGLPARQADRALSALGLRRGAAVAGTAYVEVGTAGRPAGEVRAELRRQPGVAHVEFDYIRRATRIPNDEAYAFGEQTHLNLVRGPEAWDASISSTDVVIAVVDTGVRANHEDLTGKVLAGYNAITNTAGGAGDDEGHGTAVAGVAAANTNNRVGIAGMAWQSRILPVKVLDSRGNGSDSDVAQGITWAADNGADVINLSLGGPGESLALQQAVDYAVTRGSVVVASSGNAGSEEPNYPAAYPSAISVGATDSAGNLTFFSSWGDTVDLAAPGLDLWAPDFRDPTSYVPMTGTSFSAPLVSGAAALVRSRLPGLTVAQVASRLKAAAREAGPRGLDPYYGWGLLDAAAALNFAKAPPVAAVHGDGNDTLARARVATSSQTDRIVPEGDVDVFRWTQPAGSTRLTATVTPQLTASTDGRAMAPVIEVYDSADRLVGAGALATGAFLDDPLTLTVAASGGTYNVVVRNEVPSQAVGYTLALSATGSTATATSGAAWVRDTNPVANALRVARTVSPAVVFARDIAPTSVTSSTVRLVDGTTGATVPATVTFDPLTDEATVDPIDDLVRGRPYVLRVGDVVDTGGATSPAPLRVPFVAAGPLRDRFTPLPPTRVLDTRSGLGTARGKVGAGSHRDLAIRGRNGVPGDATAAVLNVTGVLPTATTFLQVYPTPTTNAVPLVSNVNVPANVVVPNLVTAKIGAGGQVRLRNAYGSIDLVADLVGFYSPYGADAFESLDPTRILDTRTGTGLPAPAKVPAGGFIDLQVGGRGGVPADADAAVLNLTGVRPTTAGHVVAYPTPGGGNTIPTASNLNLVAGEVRPNLVVVKLGASGKVRLRSTAQIDLLADVAGYFTSPATQGLTAMDPARVLDTRNGTGAPAGAVAAGTYRDVQITGFGTVPAGATAVVLNVTGITPAGATDVRVFPTPEAGTEVPTASNLNLRSGEVRANLVTVKIGANGRVRLYSSAASIHLAADVAGWYAT